MAHVAPGLGPERNEPPCYNCGIRGHMFTACPEEPRKVPAGLEASWARQQSSNSPHSDSPMPNRRSKGPVITRYPPPPPPSSHHTPPMPRFENSPAQPYQPSQVPGYPPPPAYSPGFGHPPPYPPYDRYGPSGPPGLPPGPHQSLNPPAYHHSYNTAYGPPGPPGPPGPVPRPYDHHHAPPPGPPGPPSQYYSHDYPPGPHNQPAQYPPSQYPPGPPPSYLPPPPHFANPPAPPAPYGYNGPPPGYPQGEYNPPQHGPPPAPYSYHPPPDVHHSQSYGDDRNYHHRGRDQQRRYDDRRSTETWHTQDVWPNPPPSNDQSYRDEYREDWHSKPSYRDDRHPRKWRHVRHTDERRRDRHDRFHPYKNSDKSDGHHQQRQRSVTIPSRPVTRERSPLDHGTPTFAKGDQDREPGEIVSEPTSASDRDDSEAALSTTLDKESEDSSWDERTIFMDPPSTVKVDPIAAPLPTQYSEDVMIPPAFDAKAIKSRYITPRNVDDFAQSARETRDWQVMQHHPVFLDPEEICIEKLGDYDRAIEKDTAFRSNRRDRVNNLHDPGRQRSGRHNGKNRDPRYRSDQKKRRWNESHDDADSYRFENRYGDFPYDESFSKRFKATSPEPGEVVDADADEPPYEPLYEPSQALTPSRLSRWAPEREINKDIISHAPSVKSKSVEPSQDITNQRPNIIQPNDQDKYHTRSPTPPALPRGVPRPLSRPPSRPISRDSHRNRPISRRSSFASNMSGSQGSSLDAIDRELLGMGRPSNSGSDSEAESPKRRLNGTTPKFKRRQPMVEAYSRRW